MTCPVTRPKKNDADDPNDAQDVPGTRVLLPPRVRAPRRDARRALPARERGAPGAPRRLEDGRKGISYQDQCKSLTLVRKDDPSGPLSQLNVAAGRGALQRIDRAYQAFFRRVKAKQKPGHPRFRSRHRYNTIEINDVGNNQVRHYPTCTLVRINGLPPIKLQPQRALPETKPRTIRIVRRSTGCTVDLVYEHGPAPLTKTGENVGIDVRVRKRATLSNGERFAPEQQDWKAIGRAQRRIARSKRGSNRRRKRVRHLARLRRRQRVRSRNACHRITSNLVRRFEIISVEDLKITNMTRSARGTPEAPGRNVRQKSGLNRSILEQAWGLIHDQLAYKAAWAGRQLIEVNARFTSQACSTCGGRRSKPDGSERWRCEHCDAEHDRDVNAAINIDRAGILALGSRSGGRAAA